MICIDGSESNLIVVDINEVEISSGSDSGEINECEKYKFVKKKKMIKSRITINSQNHDLFSKSKNMKTFNRLGFFTISVISIGVSIH